MANENQTGPTPQNKNGFESGVAGLRLCDILELKERSCFHGLVVVQFQKKTAKIYFDQGALYHLETGNLTDEEALRAILKWPGGKIKVLPKMEFPRRTMKKSLKQVLIEEGLRTSDQPPQQKDPLQGSEAKAHRQEKNSPWSPNRRIGVFGVIGTLLLVMVVMGFWIFARGPQGGVATNIVQARQPKITLAPRTERLFAIAGSNTIGSQLAPKLAEEFLRKEGATRVRSETIAPEEVKVSGYFEAQNLVQTIDVRAHGSSTSFADLETGNCDIGMSSRPIKKKERLKLIELGDLSAPSAECVLAMDGLAVIVHPANGLSALSVSEVAELFSGQIRDWSELPQSGLQGPVNIYARDNKSGTYDTFKSLILKPNKLKISSAAARFEDSQELSRLVSTDPGGVGFIGLPFVAPSKALAISEPGTRAIFPTSFSVATEDYPLSRRLFLYLPTATNNASARKFVRFATSIEGQKIAKATGFIDLTIFEQARSQEKAQDAPPAYMTALKEAQRLSVNFRFRSGQTELDNKAVQDIERIVDYLGRDKNRERTIQLFGFTDSIGSYQQNCSIAHQRASYVEQVLEVYGIYPQRVVGLCDALPVASNASAHGREKNRRVEIWIN